MKPRLTFCLTLVLSFTLRIVQANTGEQAQLKAQQIELCALLAKASTNSFNKNVSGPSPSEKDFSPYLTKSENDRLVELLHNPEVAKVVTREQALAAVKQRQMDGSLPGFQYNALMDLVNQRWPHDPAVIAFYREALATRGDVAIFELWSPQPGVWDDSFLEPVVDLMERAVSNCVPPHAENKELPWIVINRALAVLNQHYDVWSKDASIAPRLSKCVLALFPSLKNPSLSGPRPGEQMWCNAVQMLAKTHDPEMLTVLRPFLNDKSLAGDGSYWMLEGRPPLRACDKAAIAIEQLLGEKHFTGGAIGMPGIPYWKVRDSYPIWGEWDKKIAELQQTLDALVKSASTHRNSTSP